MARIYFYRDRGNYLTLTWTTVWLNGTKIGSSGPGNFFYRDVQPGTYTVGVDSDVPNVDQYRRITVSSFSLRRTPSITSGSISSAETRARRASRITLKQSRARIVMSKRSLLFAKQHNGLQQQATAIVGRHGLSADMD
jgi:Protein of unknown function (DUF2846)